MSEAKSNTTVASFPEQLKRSFTPGTAERAKVKHFAAAANKWSLALLIPGLIIWLVWGVLPDIQDVRKESKVAETKVEETKRVAEPPKVSEVQKTQTVIVTNAAWTTVQVPSGMCIQAWSKDPTADDYRAQAVRVNTTKAIDWATYRSKIESGQLPDNDLGWIMFKATGEEVVVHYTFRPWPCRKSSS